MFNRYIFHSYVKLPKGIPLLSLFNHILDVLEVSFGNTLVIHPSDYQRVWMTVSHYIPVNHIPID